MHYQITNDRLVIDGRPARFVASPNHGGRIEPTLIVVHDTADRLKPDDSVNWFADPKSKVSAHFVVGRDGSVTQMVDCDRAAWHAGKSSWKGRQFCNGFAVGIEIDNPGPLRKSGDCGVAWFGDKFGIAEHGLLEITTREHGHALWMPYTACQLEAVERLVRALLIAYPTITSVAGHFEISPGRKVDPGPQFPMEHFRSILADRKAPPRDMVAAAQRRLAALQYWPGDADGIMGPRTRAAIRTFEEQNRLPMTGQLGPVTMDALTASSARPMPSAPREGATKETVAKAGSSTMDAAGKTKRTVEGLAILQIAGELVDKGEAAKGVSDRSMTVVDWLMTPSGAKFAITMALLAIIWKYADKIEWVRLRDFVLGRNAGGPV